MPLHPGKLTLLHSGLVYPSERDPTQLFAALAQVRERSQVVKDRLRIRFRAPVHDDLIRELALRHGLAEAVEICPPVGYRDALREMLQADGLLVLQAANCNAQIPAKLYEYLRAGRPVLGLTDLAGDTAQALRHAGVEALAPLDSVPDIANALERFVEASLRGDAVLPKQEVVRAASRQARARELASLLQSAAMTSPTP